MKGTFITLFTLLVSLVIDVQSAPSLPPGFKATTLVEGINAATCLTIAPDNRVFYCEQTGAIRVVKDGQLLTLPALDLSARLDTWWERGLIGLTLHPDFPRTPYIYTVYVAKAPFTHHVVSRFTVVGDVIDPESELVLIKGDDQATLGGKVPAGHQGGPICFGKDGMIYVGLGEQTAGDPSQSLTTLQGKILRIRQDGSIPEDNPFFTKAKGKYRSIYATGIRNPFGLAVEPRSGRLLETDVGGTAFEEINEIVAGGNYGWPEAEGMSDDNSFVNPLQAYPPVIGRSICGAMFYPESGNFPSKWKGRFFFVDWASHWIKAIDLDDPDKLIPFGDGFAAPVGLSAAPDGSIYLLNRDTIWRDGKKFKEGSGSLVRIRYVGETEAPVERDLHPPTLRQTGIFESVLEMTLASGFHAFSLNAPVWLPGVDAHRWIRIPEGVTIKVSADDSWQFPQNTTVVQHFDTPGGQRHETHVFISNGDGTFRAIAYRWDENQTGAALVEHSEIIPLPGSDSLMWFSPGAESSNNPELSLVGFVLQLNSRQLNRGNQLREWRERGWLDSKLTDTVIEDWPRLASLEDTEASIEHRVRSYLDSNCAACHRPGGPSRGLFDCRFTHPLKDQKIVLGDLIAGDLGIVGAKVLTPGSPDLSIIYQRMKRNDAFRMPPVSVNQAQSPVLPLLERWIREMKPVPVAGLVRLTEDAVDESAGRLPAYKIETPTATYYLEKSGAGLSSLVDRDGHDWLGFHPEPGSGAAGEYRGFPNAVHKQAGSYFHARNKDTDLSKTEVVRNDPGQVTIAVESDNRLWAGRYDFTATHCTFTMTKIPGDKKFWALYEGTPGGSYDDDDWWMTSAIKDKQSLTTKHDDDISAPEWIAFGDPRVSRSLFVYHHEDDKHPDRFYQMKKQMTVFGFGRSGINKHLDSVPQSFSIGILESDDHSVIQEAVERIEAIPRISVWYGERQQFGHLGGHPQRWINILGSVSHADQIDSLTYSLNSSEPAHLSFLEDNKRLAQDGNFNVEISRSDLKEGANHVEIIATTLAGEVARARVIVDYNPSDGQWALPYHIDWSDVDEISEVAQVVDGKWCLTGNGVRTVEPYYDRVLAFGDASWKNYEVRTILTVHGITPPGTGANQTTVTHAAIATRWPGHDPDGKQPTVKWHPLGATAEFRFGRDLTQCRWRIFDGKKLYHVESSSRRSLAFEKPYEMKHRVESIAGGQSRYRVKLWPLGEPEPEAWDLERLEINDLPSGSALLIAHHADVTFGNISISPLPDAP